MFLSAHYFSDLFLRETGCSFSDYLINLRLDAAKRLLVDTNLNISEVAANVGYADSRYFSKLFAKKVGILPKEYRKLYG